MRILDVAPFVVAQASVESAWSGLATYGPLGLWVMWMLYRDNRESSKQDQRHQENQAAMKRIEDAFRTNTDSIIIGYSGLKTLDGNYAELLAKVKEQNHAQPTL